jgi:hypothetical protein
MYSECKICGKVCSGLVGLSGHIKIHNYTKQQYYDEFLRQNLFEGKCKICEKDTDFLNSNEGYRTYCSCKCSQNDSEKRTKMKKTRTQNNPNEFVLDLLENIEKMKLTIRIPYLLKESKCQICNKKFDDFQKLTIHIISKHKIHSKTYYDYFYKKENEGICYCGKECNFIHFQYNRFCSLSCSTKSSETQKKMGDTCFENHGVRIPMQSKTIQETYKHTCTNNYGVSNPSQSDTIKQKKEDTNMERRGIKYSFQAEDIKDKIKDTMIERYGEDNPSKCEEFQNKKIETSRKNWNTDHPMQCEEVHDKASVTNIERYGETNPMMSKEIQDKVAVTNTERYGGPSPMCDSKILEKARLTNIKRRGVEWVMQDPEVRSKSRKNSFQKKEYVLPSGKIILLQGHEPHFLDYVFSNNLLKEDEIDYCPERIKYSAVDGKNHYYFCDFKLISFNLYIEIKDSYILNIQENTDLKIKATKDLGYNYIMILDQKYDEFKNMIHQLKSIEINPEVYD